MSRQDTYRTTPDTHTREGRIRRLKSELREHVRFMSDYPILSSSWLAMADSLQQIASVALMEHQAGQLASDGGPLGAALSNPLAMQGKKEDGTLWDQKHDELAVRILLEEGKLNLALRLLHSYKVKSRADDFAAAQVAAETEELSLEVVRARCIVFEQSMGLLLTFALRHVEALQIVDLPETVEYCREALEEVLAAPEAAKEEMLSTRMAAVLAVDMLHSIVVHRVAADEDRVCRLLRENRILQLMAAHLDLHYQHFNILVLKIAARFFAQVVASEGFVTDPESFGLDEPTRHAMQRIRLLFVDELIKKHGLKRKEMRPFVDLTNKWKRKFGPPEVDVQPLAYANADEAL